MTEVAKKVCGTKNITGVTKNVTSSKNVCGTKNVTEATEVTKKCDRSNKKDFK